LRDQFFESGFASPPCGQIDHDLPCTPQLWKSESAGDFCEEMNLGCLTESQQISRCATFEESVPKHALHCHVCQGCFLWLQGDRRSGEWYLLLMELNGGQGFGEWTSALPCTMWALRHEFWTICDLAFTDYITAIPNCNYCGFPVETFDTTPSMLFLMVTLVLSIGARLLRRLQRMITRQEDPFNNPFRKIVEAKIKLFS
jgi:hypothetical protein